MTIKKTIYCVAKADLSGYAYTSYGRVRFDSKAPRRSGMFNDLADAPKVLARFYKLLNKSVIDDTEYSLACKANPFPANQTPERQASYDRAIAEYNARATTEFTVVQVTVEEITR
jgi:hypothetical protein